MLKITIQIQESKDKEKCSAKIITPKDISKATENEKRCCSIVLSQIEKAMEEIKD